MALTNLKPTYDDDADDEFRPRLIQGEGQGDGVPQGDLHSVPDDTSQAIGGSALRALEGGGEGDGVPRGDLHSAKSEDASALDSVRDKEKSAGEDSLYNPKGDKQGVRQRLRGRLSNLKSHKWLLAGGVAGIGIIAVLLLLFLFLSSLKLPSVMQNIETYEFAQVTRQFSKSAQNVTDEATALDAAPDGVYNQLKAKFTESETYQNIRNTTWGRMDAYRPGKVIENLGNDNGLTFNYRNSKIPGRSPIFTGATIDNVKYDVEPVTGVAKWIPGVRQLVAAKNQAAWRNSFIPKVMETERVQNLGPIMRFRVSLAIRQEAGSGFAGWILEKFVNKSGEAADTEATQELAKASQQGMTNPDNATTDELKSADQAAETEMEQEAANAAAAAETTANNGDSTKTEAAVDKELQQSTFDKALGVASGVYAVAVPLCIIYDGSVQQSQPAIDNQMNESENVFDKLAAEADQQKQGTINPANDTALGNAIQGTSDDLGNVQDSIPYQRASGGGVDTSDQLSPEAAAGGGYTYSVFNLLGVNGGWQKTWLDTIFSNACPKLTNPVVASIMVGANLAAFIASGGESAPAEGAAETATQQTAKDIAQKYVVAAFKKLTAKVVVKKGQKTIERSALNRAMRFAFKQGIIVGGTVGLTELAHLEVASRSGYASSGFAQGPDQVNTGDIGAGVEASKLDQQQLFGRPETNSEISQSDQENSTYIANNNASLSFAQRYFSTSNPDSLVARMAMSLGTNVRLSIFQKIFSIGASLLRPLNGMASLLSLSTAAHAAPDPSTQHYGLVQFGWTQDEENLINSSDSYKPLENQQALDNAPDFNGQPAAVAIANQYAKCFGYKYNASGNGDMDPTDQNGNLQRDPGSSLGNLLAHGDIQRDDNGNVVDKGDCSPTNLGPNNPTYGDLVLRWRLAMQYDTTMDQLIGEQNVTASSSDSTTPSSSAPATNANSTGPLNIQAAEQAATQATNGSTTVGFALYDSNGNQLASQKGDTENYGASITKAMLLAAYLKQAGNGSIDATAKSELTNMIENSDNNAANWVYQHLQQPATQINAIASGAGMTGFKLDTSDATYVLGQSMVTANDFAKFFSKIDTMLPDPQKGFGLGLLANLSSQDQTGLLQAGLPGTVYSKEGWKPEPAGAAGAPYVVNQAAQFTINNVTYGVAITIGGTTNQQSGEAIAKSIVGALLSTGS